MRSLLEFAPQIWNPHYDKYINRIEKVQEKFINIINYKFNRDRYYQSYACNLEFYRLKSLKNRRTIQDMSFLYKIINNKTESNCLSYLTFNIPSHITRDCNTFYLPQTTTFAGANAPLTRLQKTYNSNFLDVDLFVLTEMLFKKEIIKKL